MARKKGTYSLSANIEVNAAAPLDARLVVDTVSELIVASNFPYPYVGMDVKVKATGDIYVLMNDDVTSMEHWHKIGGGESIQLTTMPTASEQYVGNIYQYIGTTSGGFVNGYFYKCVLDGTDYSWQESPTERAETVEISKADFDLLPQAQKDNGTAYFIPDYDSGVEHTAMGFTPVGTIISMMANHAPRHYLACNGQLVNITDYPELANHFETEFGSKNYFGGDGTTTFAVPDLRGEFLRGTGTNSHANQGSGKNVGIHQDGTSCPSNLIYKGISNNFRQYSYSDASISGDSIIGYKNIDAIEHTSNVKQHYASLTNDTDITDAGIYYTSRPTNTSVLYCIATKNIYTNPENIYSTDEIVVGQWIDGKTVYQKTIPVPEVTIQVDSNWQSLVQAPANIESLIDCKFININDGVPKTIQQFAYSLAVTSGYVSVINFREVELTFTGFLTMQYTKTTD